jgi:hypothetical protein
MRQQFERYFELLPLLAIILILIANEHRQAAHQMVEFELNAPAIDVQMPRLILR